MSWFFHPKPIDSSRCWCPCHRAIGEQFAGVPKDGLTDASVVAALTACSKCFQNHRAAFLPPPKQKLPPKNPDPFESGEEGG